MAFSVKHQKPKKTYEFPFVLHVKDEKANGSQGQLMNFQRNQDKKTRIICEKQRFSNGFNCKTLNKQRKTKENQ